MDSLVSVDWLADHLDDDDLVVLDCSVVVSFDDGSMEMRSGREAYDAGHVPGAGFADLIVDLSDTTASIGFAVPTPAAFCEAMGRIGVGDRSSVVLYDTGISVWAARVWWMLRWVGFDRAAILDGGFGAWSAGGHPVCDEHVTPTSQTLTPLPRPEVIADRHEVLAGIDDHAVTLVDTLGADHYRGEAAMYARPGHIPGAVNVPCFELLDKAGQLLGSDAVAQRHGVDSGQRMITYCGGGIAASLNAFALSRAGFDDVAVYAASLQEWAADPSLPLVTGSG